MKRLFWGGVVIGLLGVGSFYLYRHIQHQPYVGQPSYVYMMDRSRILSVTEECRSEVPKGGLFDPSDLRRCVSRSLKDLRSEQTETLSKILNIILGCIAAYTAWLGVLATRQSSEINRAWIHLKTKVLEHPQLTVEFNFENFGKSPVIMGTIWYKIRRGKTVFSKGEFPIEFIRPGQTWSPRVVTKTDFVFDDGPALVCEYRIQFDDVLKKGRVLKGDTVQFSPITIAKLKSGEVDEICVD